MRGERGRQSLIRTEGGVLRRETFCLRRCLPLRRWKYFEGCDAAGDQRRDRVPRGHVHNNNSLLIGSLQRHFCVPRSYEYRVPFEPVRRRSCYLDYNSDMSVFTAFRSGPNNEPRELHPRNKGIGAFTHCDPSPGARHYLRQTTRGIQAYGKG